MHRPNKITGPRSPVRSPGFTLEAVERRVLKALAPALEAKGGSVHSFAEWTLAGHGIVLSTVHGPRVLVDPGGGVLLPTGARAPCSFLGLIMLVMLQHVQL